MTACEGRAEQPCYMYLLGWPLMLCARGCLASGAELKGAELCRIQPAVACGWPSSLEVQLQVGKVCKRQVPPQCP